MKVVYPRCAGIDIHKQSMTVCLIVDRLDGSTPEYHKRKLATHTEGIRELCGWLEKHHVMDVGMESTGVYWKPVWNALEGKWGLHLCNPQHVRAIPGSKTDIRDGTRIGELLAYGKLPESFIPPLWQRELRDLTRLRARFKQEAARAGNRILKVLEDARIKLDCVASDPLGVTGRLILNSLMEGETDPAKLAELAVGNLKKKKKQLRQALDGNFRDHHRFQIKLLLQVLKEYEDKIFDLEQRINGYLTLHEELVRRLDEIPGIDRIGAAEILAEIGPDMSHWEDCDKLASWSCLCPGNRESGGKRLSGRTRKGNRWLRRIFCQMAWAATHKKGSYFKTLYRRVSKRRGNPRALMAVAHALLRVVYYIIREPNLKYRELGEDYLEKRDAIQTAANLVRRLDKLGYDVTLQPKAA